MPRPTRSVLPDRVAGPHLERIAEPTEPLDDLHAEARGYLLRGYEVELLEFPDTRWRPLLLTVGWLVLVSPVIAFFVIGSAGRSGLWAALLIPIALAIGIKLFRVTPVPYGTTIPIQTRPVALTPPERDQLDRAVAAARSVLGSRALAQGQLAEEPLRLDLTGQVADLKPRLVEASQLRLEALRMHDLHARDQVLARLDSPDTGGQTVVAGLESYAAHVAELDHQLELTADRHRAEGLHRRIDELQARAAADPYAAQDLDRLGEDAALSARAVADVRERLAADVVAIRTAPFRPPRGAGDDKRGGA